MNQIVKEIILPKIITPGQIYILTAEKDRGWDPGPVDEMYVLTRDEDILCAIEMEMCTVLGICYELRKFIRFAEILQDCYEFRFQCFDKYEKEEIGYSLFLHRLGTFDEKLAWAKTLLIDSN